MKARPPASCPARGRLGNCVVGLPFSIVGKRASEFEGMYVKCAAFALLCALFMWALTNWLAWNGILQPLLERSDGAVFSYFSARDAGAPFFGRGFEGLSPAELWYLPVRQDVREGVGMRATMDSSSFNRRGINFDWGAFVAWGRAEVRLNPTSVHIPRGDRTVLDALLNGSEVSSVSSMARPEGTAHKRNGVSSGDRDTGLLRIGLRIAFVLMHETGPGCIHTSYWLDEEIPDDWLHVLEVDGEAVAVWAVGPKTHSYGTPMPPWHPPFAQLRKVFGGRTAKFPLCFQKQLRWMVVPTKSSLGAETVANALNCNRDANTKCPFRGYFQFTGTRFPADTDVTQSMLRVNKAEKVSHGTWCGLEDEGGDRVKSGHKKGVTLLSPLLALPGAAEACELMKLGASKYPFLPASAWSPPPKKRWLHVLTDKVAIEKIAPMHDPGQSAHLEVNAARWDLFRGAGAVGEIWFELKDPAGIPLTGPLAWCALRLRIWFDDSTDPHVNTRLCGLVGGIAPDVKSAGGLLAGIDNGTAYCFFPMPFWESVRIEVLSDPVISFSARSPPRIRGTLKLRVKYVVGVQVYDPLQTAYFGARDFDNWNHSTIGKYATFADVPRGYWGHVVAQRSYANANSEENRKRGLPDGMQEGDFIAYKDGLRTPVFHGTGFEDHFLHSHSFFQAAADAVSAPLAGVPFHLNQFLGQGKDRWQKLTFEAYRYFIAGEFAFSDGFLGISETGSNWKTELSVNQHAGSFYSATAFYARRGVGTSNAAVKVSETYKSGSGSIWCGATVGDSSPITDLAGGENRCEGVPISASEREASQGSALTRTAFVDVGNSESEKAASYLPSPGSTLFGRSPLVTGTKKDDPVFKLWGADELQPANRPLLVSGRRWDRKHEKTACQAATDEFLLAEPQIKYSGDCNQFEASVLKGSPGCQIRRLHDAANTTADAAHVFVDGEYEGRWIRSFKATPPLRISEDVFLLRAKHSHVAKTESPLRISICPVSSSWNEIELSLWCVTPS